MCAARLSTASYGPRSYPGNCSWGHAEQMTKVEIKPTSHEYIRLIKDRLRQESVDEIQMIGPDTEDAIAYALVLSRHSWTGLANGEVACMWGINPTSFVSNMATMWMITTPLVEKHAFLFLRWSRRFVEELMQAAEFETIHGQVRADFHRSVSWLKWLGFNVQSPVEGMRYFYLEKSKS